MAVNPQDVAAAQAKAAQAEVAATQIAVPVSGPIPSVTATGTALQSGIITDIVNWLSSAPFLHAAGIAAIATLMGIGTVSVTEGLPILTGLIGLGINTTAKG